jgi:hypothetical protein
MMASGIAQGILGFLCYVGSVALVLRLVPRVDPVFTVLVASIAIYGATMSALVVAGESLGFWSYSVTYWFFGACFIVFFGAVFKSISLRILLDLLNRPDRRDSYQRVLETYVIQESYQNRLAVVQAKLLASRVDNCFVLTERGRRLASLIVRLQRAFAIERSG